MEIKDGREDPKMSVKIETDCKVHQLQADTSLDP